MINKLTTTTITSHTILRRREGTLLRLHQVPSQLFVSRRVDTTEVDKSSFFNVVFFFLLGLQSTRHNTTTTTTRKQRGVYRVFVIFAVFYPDWW